MISWHKAPVALVVGLAALIRPAVDWTSEFARQEIRWRTVIIGLTEVRRVEALRDVPH